MPRLVKKTATEPAIIGDKRICMCGLSEKQPFCDKSHLKTKGEDPDKLYFYQGDEREEIVTDTEECSGCTGNCCHEDK